jgi:hypothetical protein
MGGERGDPLRPAAFSRRLEFLHFSVRLFGAQAPEHRLPILNLGLASKLLLTDLLEIRHHLLEPMLRSRPCLTISRIPSSPYLKLLWTHNCAPSGASAMASPQRLRRAA